MSAGAARLAVEIGDPDATRTVIAIIVLLLVMGVALVMLALWQRRETRPDPTFLAPLELMGERSWRRGDPVWQRRRLDEVRPDDARPLRKAAAPPRLDEAFDAGPSASGFDDLRHDAHQDGREAVEERQVDAAGSGDADAGTREWPPRPPVLGVATAAPPDDIAVGEEDAADDRESGRAVVGVDEPDDGELALFDEADCDERAGDEQAGEGAAAQEGVGESAPSDDHGARDDADDDGRTPTGSRRPWLDLPERAIDPDALRRAMEELDVELGGSTGDA